MLIHTLTTLAPFSTLGSGGEQWQGSVQASHQHESDGGTGAQNSTLYPRAIRPALWYPYMCGVQAAIAPESAMDTVLNARLAYATHPRHTCTRTLTQLGGEADRVTQEDGRHRRMVRS